jgi:putative integral membrane protein (TIGR02587 family)
MFSLPLLYTMEMWWAGFTSQPERLLLYIAATFALLIGYNRYAGMRRDASWVEVAIDSVEEMGLGLVTAGLMLFLLGRITSEMEVNEIVGKLVMEAMTVAIGVSIGTSQLGSGAAADERDKGVKKARRRGRRISAANLSLPFAVQCSLRPMSRRQRRSSWWRIPSRPGVSSVLHSYRSR